jgi:hypothetical protein
MRRLLVSATVVITATLITAVSVGHLGAQPQVKAFQGYWMGIDPVDGGDSRRTFMQNDDGTFAMAGRDSFLTLCDETDRGIATFEDGVVVDRRTMTAALKLTCFNNGAVVTLGARYQLVSDSLMIEVLTTQAGNEFTRIVFHKVSKD